MHAYTAFAETIGQALVDRPYLDGGSGQAWVYRTPFSESGSLQSWSFFDDSGTAGHHVTPLLFEFVDSGFEIVGIGTTRTNDRSGIQQFPFGLVAGSDAIVPGTGPLDHQTTYVGWYNGDAGSGVSSNSGVIESDGGVPGSGGDFYTILGDHPPSSIAVGHVLPAIEDWDRSYSVQFNSVPPAELVDGPVINPANGHRYYLLAPATWTMAQGKAQSLGGNLVTVSNEAEQQWISEIFLAGLNQNRVLWNGLNDVATEGDFIWASGEPVSYTNWQSFEPNNSSFGEPEHYVAMNWHYANGVAGAPVGSWNDLPNEGGHVSGGPGVPHYGLVEVVPEPSCFALAMGGMSLIALAAGKRGLVARRVAPKATLTFTGVLPG